MAEERISSPSSSRSLALRQNFIGSSDRGKEEVDLEPFNLKVGFFLLSPLFLLESGARRATDHPVVVDFRLTVPLFPGLKAPITTFWIEVGGSKLGYPGVTAKKVHLIYAGFPFTCGEAVRS